MSLDSPPAVRRMMTAYAWVFLATGAVFVAAPGPLNAVLGLPNGGRGLWLGLAGSLMSVISLLSVQIARDPFDGARWDLLLLSKAVSSLLFAAFAAAERNPRFLVGTAVDSAIFVHLAVLRAGLSAPWRARARGGQEAWFVMAFDPKSRRGFWARYATGGGLARCRAVLFDKAAGRTARESWDLPLSELESGPGTAYRLREFRLGPGRAAGPSWDLSWAPGRHGAVGLAPCLLSGAGLVRAGYEAAEPLAFASGKAKVGGLEAAFADAPAGVGHLWSPHGARDWRWARAVFDRPEGPTALEVLTADAPLPAGLRLPLTAAALIRGGRVLTSAGLLASLRSSSELRGGVWRFRIPFDGLVAEGECRLDDDLSVEFPYDSPGGRGLCRTSMTGFLRVALREDGGAAAELETRDGAIVELARPA